MLTPAALRLLDRLLTAVMTLVRAVAPSDPPSFTPTLPEAAAQTLFVRLCALATRLIRISTFGLPTPAKPNLTAQEPDHPPPDARPSPATLPNATASLPRRPGWLLAALPDTAPALAAHIGTLLADPAIATLLDTAPSLHRALRPLLRALGLGTAPPITTPPRSPSSDAAPPNPAPPPTRAGNPPTTARPSKLARPDPQPSHVQLVTIS